MLFFEKLFRIPSPKKLGACCNSLPSRMFDPDCKDYCWEDYHKEVADKFPIRNFLANTLPDFIKYQICFPFWVPYVTFTEYLASHLIPSRRYHMLDLRQPYEKGDAINLDCYRYGWVDVSEKMLYAMFNLLKEYFDEEPYDLSTNYTLEQIEADPGLKEQYHYYSEAKAILHWWQVERKIESAKISALLHEWSELKRNKETRQNGADRAAFDAHRQACEDFDNKTEEMLIRLIKIRSGLWT